MLRFNVELMIDIATMHTAAPATRLRIVALTVFQAAAILETNTKGDPPALPGRQSKFDISGGRPRLFFGETPEREPQKALSWEQDDSGSPGICRFAGGRPASEKEHHRPEVCV
jgi:hypothetical protein